MTTHTNHTGTVEHATFAGGCFWCLESAFAGIPGVVSVTSGYTGGETENPTYEEVCGGETGHAEAVRVDFDPRRVSYAHLVDVFWRNIDPTDAGGQFADRGSQYRSAIFYHSEAQKAAAEASRDALNASGRFTEPVATKLEPAGDFFPAEDYHQEFYRKNPLHYRNYHQGSGRPACLLRIWGNPEK